MSDGSGNPFAQPSSSSDPNIYQKGAYKLSGAGIRIEKWNGEGDFGKWQFTTAAALRKNDVHPVVFAPEEKDPEISVLEAKEMEAWAFTTLQMAMGPNVISKIVSEKTAAGIWKRLENLYLKKTLTNRLLLMRSCLFFKMKEGTTIQPYMTEFEDIIMKLKATDSIFATDNEALALILLYSLPERYSQFTNSFIYPGSVMMRKIIEQSCGHTLKNQKILQMNDINCVACSQGKLITRPSPAKVGFESLNFMERIQGDICGPIHPPCGPFRYFMVLMDASTKWSHVCLLSSRNLAFARLLAQLIRLRAHFPDYPIKAIRLDNAGEFTS